MNTHEKEQEMAADAATDCTDATKIQDEPAIEAENGDNPDNLAENTAAAACEVKYRELNDAHLRLMAEFDNYRKRTLREKAELIKNGGETTLTALLPVVDDFERALGNIRNGGDMAALIEGVELIYNKFIDYLNRQGVKAIETEGQPFDMEQAEAVAIIPAPTPELKGRVIECVQTGYMLNDKVIRHAKVVVGE